MGIASNIGRHEAKCCKVLFTSLLCLLPTALRKEYPKLLIQLTFIQCLRTASFPTTSCFLTFFIDDCIFNLNLFVMSVAVVHSTRKTNEEVV
jgi:hypothetical protein